MTSPGPGSQPGPSGQTHGCAWAPPSMHARPMRSAWAATWACSLWLAVALVQAQPAEGALVELDATRFGGFTLGTTREELSAELGLDLASLPTEARARTLVERGPFMLAVHARLGLVAAFLDRLPGVAIEGGATLPPTASFDDARTRLGLESTRTLGRADVLQPDLPRGLAVELSRGRVAMGGQRGVAQVRDRVLVFAFDHVRYPQALAYVRAVIIRHHLDGTLTR
jgi:hypothetical protein